MDEKDIIRLTIWSVRQAADEAFEKVGGSSRDWVIECFLPALERNGLKIIAAPTTVEAEVLGLKHRHSETWSDKPEWRWTLGLGYRKE